MIQVSGHRNVYNETLKKGDGLGTGDNTHYEVQRCLLVDDREVLEVREMEAVLDHCPIVGHGITYQSISHTLTYLTHQEITRKYKIIKRTFQRFEMIQAPKKTYWA